MRFESRAKKIFWKIVSFFSKIGRGAFRFLRRIWVFLKTTAIRALDKIRTATSYIWKKIKVPLGSALSYIASLPWKRIANALLFPKKAVLIMLVPVATVFLVHSLSSGEVSALAVVSYVLSFYTLLTVCLRMPDIITFIRKIKNENKYLKQYFGDPELRVRISLHLSLLINISYAVFQIVLGAVHSSLWYYSLGAYYAVLSIMRFFVVRYDGGSKSKEFAFGRSICISVGVMLLVMTLVLSVVILHMITLGIMIEHHQITTIAMAAYTFTALTLAIVEIVRRRGLRSVVFTVSKYISLVCALVSIITLENAMITAFGGDDMMKFSMTMTGIVGAVICATIVVIAIIIIKNANKELQKR